MDLSKDAWSLSPHDVVYVMHKLVRRLELDDIVALIILAFLSFVYLSYGCLWAKPEPDNPLFFVSPQDTIGITQKSQSRKNVVEKMSELDKDVGIFFGSQSGKGQGFASSLARECRARLGINALVADLDDYEHTNLSIFPSNKIMILMPHMAKEVHRIMPTLSMNIFSIYVMKRLRSWLAFDTLHSDSVVVAIGFTIVLWIW